jgi:hypothetical protein
MGNQKKVITGVLVLFVGIIIGFALNRGGVVSINQKASVADASSIEKIEIGSKDHFIPTTYNPEKKTFDISYVTGKDGKEIVAPILLSKKEMTTDEAGITSALGGVLGDNANETTIIMCGFHHFSLFNGVTWTWYQFNYNQSNYSWAMNNCDSAGIWFI